MVTLDPTSLLIATKDVAFHHRDALLRHTFLQEFRSIERVFLLSAVNLVLDQHCEHLQASANDRNQEQRELRQRYGARRLTAWAAAHPALSLN